LVAVIALILSFISLCICTYLVVNSKSNKEIPAEKIEEIKQNAVQDLINSYLYGDEDK